MLHSNPNPPANLLIHGLCGMVGLFLMVQLAAEGQSPTAASHLLEHVTPEDNHTRSSTTDRSRPLFVYHRDQQEPEVGIPNHLKPSGTATSQGELAKVGQQKTDRFNQPTMPTAHAATPIGPTAEILPRLPANPEEATVKTVVHAQHPANDPRRLRSSSTMNSSNLEKNSQTNPTSSTNNRLSGIADAFPSMDILRTAGTGLGVALGLLLLCTWLFRRNMPSPTTPLPKEVVSVLGRSQLAARQFVQLLRVGNKLVLVSITPEGTKPITEVTDPIEVDRLLGLCMRNHTHSTTAEFQQVLNQLSREGAKGFLEKK